MRRAVTTLAAVVALVGTLPPAPGGAITNGEPDGNAHPFVGQLLFYVPDEVDPRFEDPGSWFNCSGTLITRRIVLTAGHCTFAIGDDGASTTAGGGDGRGGNDVWVNFDEVPSYEGFPPSSNYGPDENQERYADRVAWLATQPRWHRGRAYSHPNYDEAAFFRFDLGVVVLDEPVRMPAYGRLPALGQLDPYQTMPRRDRRFTTVGYGLETVLPFAAIGGDTRRAATQMLITLNGTMPSLQGTWAIFSSNRGVVHKGGTCYGDSGGPVFVEGTRTIVAVVSFGISPNCTGTSGGYRVDQADDLNWLRSDFGLG
ncbi:MAG: hypothetical protein KatS3mg013_1547 [Actinomycetota bacterium]|jgi:hypothetical protein|nr:MAG: hypothetical protein KatS3mg013_1547 [Actinomycetota bacterium]